MKLHKFSGLVMFVAVVLFSYGTTPGQVVEKVKDAASKTKDVTVDAAKKTADVVGDGAEAAVDKTKDIAGDTKDASVGAAKKSRVFVKDGINIAADKTLDAADATGDAVGSGVKTAASKTKQVGRYTVGVTDNVAGKVYEGGRYYTVKSWDGTKWASKQVWYNTKKAASATKDFVVGDGEKQP